MKKYNNLGFTLIELALTVAIISILAAVAGSTILRAMPRMRVRSDAWGLYQALTKAKYLTINENRPYGVVILHPGGAFPDSYWVFKDWDGDGVYDDTTNGPYRQCDPAVDNPTPCDEDPIYGSVSPLNANNFYKEAFGKSMTLDGSTAVITFTNLGGVSQLGTLGSNVFIQSRTVTKIGGTEYSYQGGIRLDFASGITTVLPTVRKPK